MKKLILFLAFLFAALPAEAALSVVQSAQNGGTSLSTLTVTISTSANNLLVIWCRQETNNTNTMTVSDTASQTWTLITLMNNTGQGNRGGMFYKENSAAVTSVTCSWGSSGMQIGAVVYEISGAASSGSLDVFVTAGNTANTTTLTSGSLTTISANEILLCAGSSRADQTTYTAGTSYTIPTNGFAPRVAIEYQVVSSIQTAVTASMTWSPTSAASYSVFASFKAAAAATPGGATGGGNATMGGAVTIGR